MKISIPSMLGSTPTELASQYSLQSAILEAVAVFNETNCCENPQNVFGLLTKSTIDIFKTVMKSGDFGEMTDRKKEVIFALVYANEKTNRKFEETITQMMDSLDLYL